MEEEGVRIEVGVFGEAIEGVFEAGLEVVEALFEGEQDAHEDLAGSGASVGLRTETDFPGDDQGAQRSFREVVVGGDIAILDPAIHPFGIATENVLDILDARVTGGMLDGLEAGLLGPLGVSIELRVADRKTSQTHGIGQKGGECAHEGLNFRVIREFLAKVFDFSQ